MALWLIILGFFGLLVFQNQEVFFQQQTLGIDLFVIEKIEVPPQFLVVFFLCFFLLGLLITYFFGLYTKFKSNQIIKGLNQKIDSFVENILKLEAENESLKTALMEKRREVAPQEALASVEDPAQEEQAEAQDATETEEKDTVEAKS